MGTITVEKLYNYLKNAIAKDPTLKDKKIMLSDDDEGNGYHEMFYLLTTGQDAKECFTICYGEKSVKEGEYDDYVILG